MAEMPERDAAFLLDMLLAARDALSFVEGLDDRRGGAAEIWAIPGLQGLRRRMAWKNLSALASETGGSFFENNNDINKGLANLLDDNSAYYLLGFQPETSRWDGKLHKIKVETSLTYKPPGPNAGGNLPFKIMKADLNSKDSNGNILFDSAKGRVSSSNMTMKLTGTLTIEIGGTASDVTLDQTQTTTVKTTDENPLSTKK